MRSVVLRGPAARRIALYRVVRFGPVPVPVRRRVGRCRCVAWSMVATVIVGLLT